MKLKLARIVRKLVKEELGQALPILTFGIMSMIGMIGIAIEVGHGYYGLEELQASTNAAALAGAAGLPNTTTATTNVAAYSSANSDKNTRGILTSAVATPTFECLNAVSTTLGTPCETSTGAAGGYNSIKVVQTASVPTWIANVFGMSYFNISATASAAMRGGQNTPSNIAVVLDTTASMSSNDSGKDCTTSTTQITCALEGLQQLLLHLDPCTLNTTCSNSSTPVDAVALFVFPPVLSTTAQNDYTCPTSNPTHEYYEVPTLNTLWTYNIIPFSEGVDYRSSDTAATLNTLSDAAIAAGASGSSSCSGIKSPGGAGTYYAQVIYTAQAALIAQQKLVAGSRNVMIILSDGDATACATSANTSAGACNTAADLQTSYANSLNGLTTNNPTSYTYPSAVGECGQAVVAAQAAATAGTWVYTIGYGAETSGCLSDKTYSATVTGGAGNWAKSDDPCQAMAAMASDGQKFFSDDGNGCSAPNTLNYTTLASIFVAIGQGLTAPRLIPNGTT